MNSLSKLLHCGIRKMLHFTITVLQLRQRHLIPTYGWRTHCRLTNSQVEKQFVIVNKDVVSSDLRTITKRRHELPTDKSCEDRDQRD